MKEALIYMGINGKLHAWKTMDRQGIVGGLKKIKNLEIGKKYMCTWDDEGDVIKATLMK